MLCALHLLCVKAKAPNRKCFPRRILQQRAFHMDSVNFLGLFRNCFDSLGQGEEKKKLSEGKADDHIPLAHTLQANSAL